MYYWISDFDYAQSDTVKVSAIELCFIKTFYQLKNGN